MFKFQRTLILLDVQNLYHSAKNIYKARVNFKELVKRLNNNRNLIRAFAYVVKCDTILEKGFFDALIKSGIELRIKDLLIYPDGTKKADWDVGLAIDAVRLSSLVDVVILVSGDADFLPLVSYLKWGKGVQVEIAAFSKTCSSVLRKEADYFIPIEEIPKVFFKAQSRKTTRENVERKNF